MRLAEFTLGGNLAVKAAGLPQFEAQHKLNDMRIRMGCEFHYQMRQWRTEIRIATVI